jgi:hypothetical protein
VAGVTPSWAEYDLYKEKCWAARVRPTQGSTACPKFILKNDTSDENATLFWY